MPWTLTDTRAQLNADRLHCEIELSSPIRGLQSINYADQQLGELKPLQITAHPPVTKETILDSYIRGADLVATYAQLPERTVRPQLYFKDLSESLTVDSVTGIECVVSVQTSLLDSDPTFSILSEVNSKEILGMRKGGRNWDAVDTAGERELDSEQFTGAFIFRLADCDVSYAEIIYPTDFQGGTLTGGDSATFGYQLFPDFFLEKGVIRRGRIWSLCLPQQGDTDCVQKCVEEMLASPPPLTV